MIESSPWETTPDIAGPNAMGKHDRLCLIAAVIASASLLFACSSPPQEPVKTSDPTAQPSAAGGSPIYEGFHDGTNCVWIYGWVWDRHRPDTSLSVEIYSGDILLATVPADVARPDLVVAGKGNGRHGVRYSVPDSLKDGKPRSIRLKIAGTDFSLRGTPKTITCSPP